MTFYENNIEHLFDELRRIDLIVSLNIQEQRSEHQCGECELQGLYISESEVEAILQTPPFGTRWKGLSDQCLEKMGQLTREIQNKKTESIEKGKELRLHTLREIFGLSPFEVDVILICLAPELDLRYEKLYSYIQDDVTKKRPTVDLVMNLLCSSMEERLEARECFSQTAVLVRDQLIRFTGHDAEDQLPLISRSIKVDDRIINYLLGSDEIDNLIRDISRIIEPDSSFDELILNEEKKRSVIELIDRKNSPLIFFFYGPYGAGKKMTAEAVCKELGKPMLVVDVKNVNEDKTRETITIILREALLQGSSLYLDGVDTMLNQDNKGIDPAGLIHEIDNCPGLSFLSGDQPWELKTIPINHAFITHEFHIPSFTHRKELWETFLKDVDTGEDVDTGALAGKFNFSGGQIKDAIFTARNIAITKKPGTPVLSMMDLLGGCKAQSNKKLITLAKKIEPRHTWEDIVLPVDTIEQLKEVGGYIKHKGKVFADWGFEKKLSLGKGLNVLFVGPSGTGKTMAAEILAGKVGLDLYKIDLSSVVSKYIGDTEKNLQKIFNEAETSNAILFFDEADALFGKRSEIKDSHDRYANIEINYLLQKMEEHEGIVILASNFKKNIDEAFLRRMHFAIEFPLPDEKSRKQIWKNIFPEDTPVGKDVDYDFLAGLKITGGNIKNVALSAAFLAADDSGKIRIEHIIKATKREFQKMGKLCTSGEFGKYYELVK